MRVGLNDAAQAIAQRGQRCGALGDQQIPNETVLMSDESDLSDAGFCMLGGHPGRVLMPLRRFLFGVCHDLLDGIGPQCHSVFGAPFPARRSRGCFTKRHRNLFRSARCFIQQQNSHRME